MISAIISRLVILLFGTLYPAYASYKAVRTKNVKEYVKWMMYWIVFALFTCAETFTDVFLSFWFPFYYEIKIVIVVWLLSPATKGSSILYRNFVHPALTRREQEIDEYISKAKEQGYHTMLHLGSKGVTYATNVIMQTAIKGGGGIVNHLRRSYSLSDLADETDLKADLNRNSKLQDTVDSNVPRDPRLRTTRKPLGSHIDLYFPEMDVDIRSHHSHELPVSLSQIRSNEDISSGYSSAEPLFGGEMAGAESSGNPLVRTASVGATRARPRTTRTTVTAQPKKPLNTEEFEADFGAEFGWQHSFPPIPIASLFPELCNIDPSRFPPHAFLSPEALQHIYAGSLYNREPCSISELNDGRETKAELPEEKLFVGAEQNDSSTEDSGVTDPNITTENKQTESVIPLNLNEKNSRITELEPSVNLPTKEKAKIANNESEPPSVIHNGANINSDDAVTEVFKKVVVLTEELIDSNELSKEISNSEPKEIETNEYFEDASDVEVQGIMALNARVRLSSSESNFAETQNGNMKPTTSLESVASSDDQGFEDSVPDVTMMSGWESPSNEDRRGKNNKAKAPPPPDTKPNEKQEFVEESKNQFSGYELPVQPSPSQSSTRASESIEHTSPFIGEKKYTIQDNLSASNLLYRDVSPTPSIKSKKDSSSNFSRFLPKTGMTSLFGFWGPKDEGRPTSGRKSPSGIYYSSSSTGSSETSGYRISTPLTNDETVKSTSKLLIRQMSHSPSRKRHY